MTWRSVPLRSVYRRVEDSGRPDLPLLSVYRDHGVVLRAGREDNHNKASDDLTSYKVVHPGDLVLNKMKTWQGSLAVSLHHGIVSPAYFVARPSCEVNDRFMHYLLRSLPLIAEYGARSKGIRPSQWDLPWDEFASIRVRLPGLREQRAIADYLDTETTRINALVVGKQRLIVLLGERTEQRIAALVLPGFDPSARAAFSDGPALSEAPEGWTTRQLGQMLRYISYGFTNPMPAVEDGPYMLTANDVQDGYVSFESARHTSQDAFERLLTAKSRPVHGDVLLTKDGTLGRVAMFDGPPSCINQSVAVLRLGPGQPPPELLVELLRSTPYRSALIHEAGGTTIKHLYISRVAKLRIALPPSSEWTHLLSAIGRERQMEAAVLARLDRQIGLLVEHRQALTTAAVTGDLEIPGLAA